jgi:hypothetical protein
MTNLSSMPNEILEIIMLNSDFNNLMRPFCKNVYYVRNNVLALRAKKYLTGVSPRAQIAIRNDILKCSENRFNMYINKYPYSIKIIKKRQLVVNLGHRKSISYADKKLYIITRFNSVYTIDKKGNIVYRLKTRP